MEISRKFLTGNVFKSIGGKIATRRHLLHRIDEPEAELLPQRQLALFSLMKNLAEYHGCQCISTTNSPIVMTQTSAPIFKFGNKIQQVT